MLSPFDDHPIHQLAEPVTHLASADRNAFERYRFHGGRENGSLLFGATLALYPNREIIDASLSVVHDGIQHSIHASARLATGDRTLHVGPFSVEVNRPLQLLRLFVGGPLADELGIEATLTFVAVGLPLEAPRRTQRTGGPFDRDTKRFSQWGTWEGDVHIDGRRHAIHAASTIGARERSWGTAPVGEPVGGAPLLHLPQELAASAIVCIGEHIVDAEIVEDEHGRRRHGSGRRTAAPPQDSPPPDPFALFAATDPAGDGPAPAGEPLRDVAFTFAWAPGTRRPAGARLEVAPWNEDPAEVELDPLVSMALRGLGYQSPDWVHGAFKAEAALGRESWRVNDLDPEDVHNLHWLSLCRARRGETQGIALLEVLPLGPHAPSGLTGFTDGFTDGFTGTGAAAHGQDVPPR